MSENKTIVVDPETHKQAKINATEKGKQIKEYIAELVKQDTKKK